MKFKLLKLSGLLLAAATAAHAQLYVVTGAQTGVRTSLTFSIDDALNRVSVFVQNNELGPGGVTGTLTSFGFNVPNTLIATASLVMAPTGFVLSRPFDLNAGGNVFSQDLGAMTGNNPNGGDPQDGFSFGESGTFVFQFAEFSGTAGFLGTNGVSGRFQVVGVGPNGGGGSDAGFGNPGTGPGPVPIVPVPEPSTYGMIGAACLLAGALVRRKLRARQTSVA